MDLKRWKPLYWIYNLLHYRQLLHNRAAYKKYRPGKPLIGSISSKDFPDKESKAWLDVGDSALLAPAKPGFEEFPVPVQHQLREWSRNGYLLLENFFAPEKCEQINQAIDELLQAGKLKFKNGTKLMFAFKKSNLINEVANDPELLRILNFILDKEVVPFQTINFIQGSEQRAHSDSIHMTTYPLGYLIAAWIALEDISADNGPLFYYPGSHQLPFLLNSDYNVGETALTLGKNDYTDYEDKLEDILSAKNFEKKEFHARKGDVFVWHANLVHGGAPILNKELTRKSMVIHYFARDVIKYHEITERPSLLDQS